MFQLRFMFVIVLPWDAFVGQVIETHRSELDVRVGRVDLAAGQGRLAGMRPRMRKRANQH